MADTDVKSNPRLLAYRGEARKILRDKINAEAALDEIEQIESKLHSKAGKLSAPAVGALKAVLESKWKRVAKILPDIKAVEHDPGEHAEKLARDQLNLRLAELYAAAHSRIDGPGSTGVVQPPESPATTH